MIVDNETDDEAQSIPKIPLPVNSQPQSLIVKVQPSENFYDIPLHNKHLENYKTQSKKRGRFLIINNYEFSKSKGEYRNGADVDNTNLVTLFKQMGGWDIIKEENKTAAVSTLFVLKIYQPYIVIYILIIMMIKQVKTF